MNQFPIVEGKNLWEVLCTSNLHEIYRAWSPELLPTKSRKEPQEIWNFLEFFWNINYSKSAWCFCFMFLDVFFHVFQPSMIQEPVAHHQRHSTCQSTAAWPERKVLFCWKKWDLTTKDWEITSRQPGILATSGSFHDFSSVWEICWWFQTCFFPYGMSSFPLTISFLFKMVKTTNQL